MNRKNPPDIYELSISEWVARRFHLVASRIRNVEFTVIHGGSCDTCAYDTNGIGFNYGTSWRTEELPEMTASQFFRECATIKEELEKADE